MRRLILVIGGFTEQRYEKTGSRKLWEELVPFGGYKTHDDIVFVEMQEWHADWKKFAKWMNALGVSEALVCAYSYGAGHGLREFSKRFTGQIKAVLCDPVFRSKYPWMRWRAIAKFWQPTIKYPDNVEVRKWFYQDLDEPGNDNVKAGKLPRKAIKLNSPHTEIDSNPAYHEACIAEAKKFIQS